MNTTQENQRKPYTKSINHTYQTILNRGYKIDIKSGDSGYARMYLLNSKDERISMTEFRDNRSAAYKLNEFIKTTKSGTHLDNAMKSLLQYIPVGNVV
ncbi:hypothetical protein LA345_23375 [Burkholderia vietnamiensis]|nr:hypothetical protein [Burkholderia vietnamiensis]